MSQPLSLRHSQIDSGQAVPLERSDFPRTVSTLGPSNDLSLSLLQLLAAWDCPSATRFEILRLGKTDPECRELEALLHLWQSLGRPASVFWRETRVFVNRIQGT